MKKQHLSHLKYRSDIDGLRAIAVLTVVLYHYFPTVLPSGFIGVDVFFVISGYLISLILFKNFQQNSFSYIEFYTRRILRIFPALCLVLITIIIAGYFLLHNNYYKPLGRHILGGIGFVANFLLINDSGYFDISGITKPLRNLWSLGVEEQFYIIWPILIGLFWKMHRQKFFLFVTLLVATASFFFNICIIDSKANFAFYSPWTRYWELMIGGILAYFALHQPEKISRYPNTQSLIGFVVLISGFWLINDTLEFPGYWALFPCIGAFFIIASSSSWINRAILGNKLFVFIGLISYPLYLWHWPILSIIYDSRLFNDASDAIPIQIKCFGMIASFILAWLTYQWVEKPIRLHKKYIKTKTITLCLIMIVLGYTGYVIYQKDGYPSRFGELGAYIQYFDNTPPSYHYIKQHHIYETFRKKCNFHDVKRLLEKNEDGYTRSSIDKSCYTPNKNSSKTIFIWGDSHAEALYKGLENTLPPSVSILQVASSACGPDLLDHATKTNNWCPKSNKFALSIIKKEKPDIVIMAQYKGHYINHLRRIVAELKKLGVPRVLVIGPDPAWVPDLNQIIAEHYWPNTPKRISVGLYPYVFEEERNLKAALKPIEEFEYVSLLDLLCNNEGCLAYLNNDKWYGITTFDNGHLTEAASTYVAKNLLTPLIMEQRKSVIKPLKIQFNHAYTISSLLPFLALDGFSNDEPSPGLWTENTTPSLTLYLTKKQLQKHPTGNINIKVTPFLSKNLEVQKMLIHWGNKKATYMIHQEKWISLPYQISDWQALGKYSNLEKMIIQFNLPNASSPSNLGLGDDPRMLGLRFLKIAINVK